MTSAAKEKAFAAGEELLGRAAVQRAAWRGRAGKAVGRRSGAAKRARGAATSASDGRPRTRGRIVRALACVGTLALFLAIALLVGDSDYRATPVGWVPFFVALFAIALAQAYVRLAERWLGFHEKAQFGDCQRGSNVPFTVTFENRGFLVLLNVRARLYVSDAQGGVATETVTSMTLGPHASVDVPFDVPFDHIGMFEAGLREVEVGDFLGLFRRTWRNVAPSEICVTPKVPLLGTVRLSDNSDVEAPKPVKAVLADSLDYAYVRDYVPGDPLKTIHWKLSARSENYLTRLYERNTAPGVLVVLDFFTPGDDAQERLGMRDAVVESGLAVARFAASQGMDVELRFTDRYGEARRLARFDEMAALRLVRDMPACSDAADVRCAAVDCVLAAARDVRGQNNIVVCSANVGPDMVGAVMDARANRKAPLFVAAVPRHLVDRDLDRYLAPLSVFEGTGVSYLAVSRSDELQGGSL